MAEDAPQPPPPQPPQPEMKAKMNPLTKPTFANGFGIMVDDTHTRLLCTDSPPGFPSGPIHTLLVIPNNDAAMLAREILKAQAMHAAKQSEGTNELKQ